MLILMRATGANDEQDRNRRVGAAGCPCTTAAVNCGSARKIGLVDSTCKRADAMATDIRYGTPLTPKVPITDGDYPDLADAGVVMITAGIKEKTGGATNRDPQGRLRLFDKNTAIYRDIVPRVVRASSDTCHQCTSIHWLTKREDQTHAQHDLPHIAGRIGTCHVTRDRVHCSRRDSAAEGGFKGLERQCDRKRNRDL